jgi:S-(hydroxymethyl)glutathione dehydrogenase / alcohol dehydrogenase
MKAAVLNAYNGIFDIEELDIDAPIGHEVLVEVKAAGLCHSDLHLAENDFGTRLPAVFGHELAGIVKAIGPSVREFQVGDHVVGSVVGFCGHCEACLSGHPYRCLHPEDTKRGPGEGERLTRKGAPVTPFFGVSAFAEYTLVHERQLAKVPAAVPFKLAAVLGCGCVTGAGAVINTAQVRPGEMVAVFGIGGIGLNVISGARLAGASKIIAIDLQASKEPLARKLGATDFLVSSEVDIVATVHSLTGGGVHHAFEAIGLKKTAEQTIKIARKGGNAYMIGVHKPGSTIDVDVMTDLIRRQVSLRGVYMGSTNIKHDIPMFADLYLQGRFNLDDLVSKEISLSEINEAYEEVKKGAIARTVVTSF